MGTVAGLVSITPACGYVSPMASTAIASIGAVSAFYGMRLKNFLGYDDALDVFACHGVAGVAGTVLTGCFASLGSNPAGDNGLLFGTNLIPKTWFVLRVHAVRDVAKQLE
jgi:Amt family ammonium transporter